LEIEHHRAVVGLWLLCFETCHWERDLLIDLTSESNSVTPH